MRRIVSFLVLWLIPLCIFGLDKEAVRQRLHHASNREARAGECIENAKQTTDRDESLRLLDEAEGSICFAIVKYDEIIHGKRKHRHNQHWHNEKRQFAMNEKSRVEGIRGEIAMLRGVQHALKRADPIYAEGVQRAEQAQALCAQAPREADSVEKCVADLHKAGGLFDAAAAKAAEAAEILVSVPGADCNPWLQSQVAWQRAGTQCRKDAINWPTRVLEHRVAMGSAKLLLAIAKHHEKQASVAIHAVPQTLTSGEDAVQAYDKAAKHFERAAKSVALLANRSLSARDKASVKERLEYYQKKAQRCNELAEAWLKMLPEERAFAYERLLEKEREAKALKEQGHLREAHSLTEEAGLLGRRLGERGLEDVEDIKARLPQVRAPPFAESTEEERRELFFTKAALLLHPEHAISSTKAIPLDGQGYGTLFRHQAYRFLIPSTAQDTLVVRVHKEGAIVHIERIHLPQKHSTLWDRYLTKEGMVLIPKSPLEAFGLHLRLMFVPNPDAFIATIKLTHPDYAVSFAFDDEPLCTCTPIEPPPWQLQMLRKPALAEIRTPLAHVFQTPSSPLVFGEEESAHYPLLDRLVEDLKRDPLALAQFVQNEIAFIDPAVHRKDGIFTATKILRNPCMTFLERRGTPWEQCALLVYLLRKAGYSPYYCYSPDHVVPKALLEKLLLVTFDGEARVDYPWIAFNDGETRVTLFPWLKEIQIEEGYDIYGLMPEEFASADRWVMRYLQGDERIVKHIGADGDDTAGVLFLRTAEEELCKQGLSLADIGIKRSIVHKQYTSWDAFPRIEVPENHASFPHLPSDVYAHAAFTFSAGEHSIELPFRFADLNCASARLDFEDESLRITFPGQETRLLPLASDAHTVRIQLGSQALHIKRGDRAALCFSFLGQHSAITTQYYNAFAEAKGEEERVHALLAYLGAAYFERCARMANALEDVHKISASYVFGWGCTKFIPSGDSYRPQVDMLVQHQYAEDYTTSRAQCRALQLADASANEHQILRDVFHDQDVISTVKLLQQAYASKQGFLVLTPTRVEEADAMPEAAQVLYFPEQEHLRTHLDQAESQWKVIKDVLSKEKPLSAYGYAYMTPGPVTSAGGNHREMGALILHPETASALISQHELIAHGGAGSPLWANKDEVLPITEWKLHPQGTYWSLQYTPEFTTPPTSTLHAEVHQDFKSPFQAVGDPVDVTTGAYTIDTIDLLLPGPIPLHIRRNYSSQHPIDNPLGHGWRFSLNPTLVEQDGLLFAAEEDGTLIAYRRNPNSNRWEVHPDDNPELWNTHEPNPFQAYIENDILYSPDGSTKHFENGLLKTWTNARGQTLTFTYAGDRLTRIESSFGAYIGFHYNGEGRISEIFAQDGRRIAYSYNAHGDLVEVTLPNKATIAYTYDDAHRITRETKPHGQILENAYDEEGRVKQQRAFYGHQQMSTTQFLYTENGTEVIDPLGFRTKYTIFEKQITKIIDPEGHCIRNSWYIDDTTWYDAEAECIRSCDHEATPRSLKIAHDKRGLRTEYTYDARGNPATITISGQDLTGDGGAQFCKRLTYNERNLCIAEQTCNRATHITYDETHPYVPKRIETLADNTLISYDEYTYNTQGLLQCEEHSGAITRWEYDSRGFPTQRTQQTGTNDPDVIVTFRYNNQGQCFEQQTPNATTTSTYDIMGNCIHTQTYSLSGELLSLTYTGYNENNQPLWQRGANPNDFAHFDYDSAGLLKAKRQTIDDAQTPTYAIYAYDARGSLVEEVDPSGHCTSRSYDALARLQSVTQNGKTTTLTYEPGGSLASVTTPKGVTTRYSYSTNGLCTREECPDGTSHHIVYDFFGRPTRETQEGITWHIHYDDAHRTILRVHPASGAQEHSSYDVRGNLIRHTDAAGRTWEKSYDCLNRITSETNPSGETTHWTYASDTIICTRPNGERVHKRYAGDELLQEEVFDASGLCISRTAYRYDITHNALTIQRGDEITKVITNHCGQPTTIDKGGSLAFFAYDACGNGISTSDEEGRTTRHSFDALHRKTCTQFPDGTHTHYVYDEDSHLTEYHLPNDTIWHATYDPMGRIATHELRSTSGISSQRCAYHYAQGRLAEMQDPLNRTHTYQYDALGRRIHEHVDGWHRAYTYDPSGLLTSAEQCSPHGEISLVERSYDASGRIASEDITLNGMRLQHTEQTWTPSSRTLKIGQHSRHHSYQNGKLTYTTASNIALGYEYTPSGRLQQKSSPYSQTTIERTLAGLPHVLRTQANQRGIHETLEWNKTQRLSRYTANDQEQTFAYTDRGFLRTAGPLQYAHNAMGTRTEAPQSHVPEQGIDAFGQVTQEIDELGVHNYAYDASGQLTVRDQESLTWDPWGRLIEVASPHYQWSASYDALGRRLQTIVSSDQGPSVTTSLYDPEEEFQEIGVCIAGKTFWKYYDPEGICDALSDDAGNSVSLVHNALHQLVSVLSSQGDVYNTSLPTPYGPVMAPALVQPDLLSVAQSLVWHSTAQDPTGLIWLGVRYYDPRAGRFLSPDPVGHPACLGLYSYANGDPLNFHDPDGRFATSVYEPIKATVISGMYALFSPDYESSFSSINAFEVFSSRYEIPGRQLKNMVFGFGNGLFNSFTNSIKNAEHLSRILGGIQVVGQCNINRLTPFSGLPERICERLGKSTLSTKLYRIQWEYIMKAYPDKIYVQTLHSWGAVPAYNALKEILQEKGDLAYWARSKMIVIGVAPAAIIHKGMCLASYNFACSTDLTIRLINSGSKHKNELELIEPELGDDGWSRHEFVCPTLTNRLKNIGEKIINIYEK